MFGTILDVVVPLTVTLTVAVPLTVTFVVWMVHPEQ